MLHVSQVAELLGLPPPPGNPPEQEGREAQEVLRAWIETLREASWHALLAPTPARGRSLRNLTVNVFHPFELLPAAWWSGEFAWRPEDDGVREQRFESRDDLLAFAVATADGWLRFLQEEHLRGPDRVVETARGRVPFSVLVSFQRWHAAYHYRQLVHVLGAEDRLLLEHLVLPREVF